MIGAVVKNLGEAALVYPVGRRPLVARHRREAVRARPRDGARAQRGALARLPRAADLPHRPLPRQGDDAEHPRLPPRERDLRAALEPPVRRPRADHGRRVDRRREPRPLLRGGGRPARHHPEPRPPAPLPRRDGAARGLRPERRARREGEGSEVHPAADARGDHARHGARPVRRGGDRRPARRRLPGGEGRQRDVPARDVRGVEGAGRELALGGRAVLPARGQAARQARHGDRDPVQDAADLALPAGRRHAAGAERPHPEDPARRGHRAEVRREGARARR